MDSATGQRAFVLGFAALAVAGGAYFATIMMSPESDPGSVVATANARPQEVQGSVAAATAPLATKPAEEMAAAAPKPVTPEAKAVAVAPVPVKTQKVPAAKATATAAKPTAAPAEEPQVAAIEPVADAPVTDVPVNAYAGGSEELVTDGIEAVMGIAVKENLDDQLAVAPQKKAAKAETQVAAAVPEMAGGSTARKVRTDVTMRARPANGATVVGTIPANAGVTVAPGCKSWCQVSYNGKRGYIYKGFLR